MDVLVLLAIAESVRLVVRFFGSVASRDWAIKVVEFTEPITIPLGVDPVTTPYGGVFDVAAAVSIFVILVGEWILSVFRTRG